jgi:hypothetical protein
MQESGALERLERLRRGDPALISAADLNWLVTWANRSRKLDARYGRGVNTPFPHPWKVQASRCAEIERGWRLDVAAGVVNDIIPGILYRRKDDPRGWEMPEDYVESPAKGELGWNADWVERDLLDDLNDPPWLLMVSPALGSKADPAWTFIPRARWIPYFAAQVGMENAQIFRAFVMVSQDTRRSAIASGTWLRGMKPPAVNKFRIGTLPARPGMSLPLAGVWLELATLWLVRPDPDAPEADAVYVQQAEFWPAWCVQVKPSLDLGAGIGVPAVDMLLDMVQRDVDLLFDRSATVMNWTV